MSDKIALIDNIKLLAEVQKEKRDKLQTAIEQAKQARQERAVEQHRSQ